jgi:hypothetical protein
MPSSFWRGAAGMYCVVFYAKIVEQARIILLWVAIMSVS